MIDVKTAIQKARNQMGEFFPDKKESVRLEEVLFNENLQEWIITMSYLGEKPENSGFDYFSQFEKGRVFKQLKIDAEKGVFLEMKIRELQVA